MKKGFLDISFSWIFAILIGGMILFGAIYGVTKFGHVQNTFSTALSATSITNLFDSLTTSSESLYVVYLSLPIKSRIRNSCDSIPPFGSQSLSVQQKVKNSWQLAGLKVYSNNEYVFSEPGFGTKGYFAMTKPFNYPFKIANLIYLIPQNENYCFVGAPLKIKKELQFSNVSSFKFGNCKGDKEITTVCFDNEPNCNVTVDYNSKEVTKNGDTLYFSTDSLMYGAIFADKKNYECETKRLMERANELATIYKTKGVIIQPLGCSMNALSDLETYQSLASSYNSSADLENFYSLVNSMGGDNNNANCRLW